VYDEELYLGYYDSYDGGCCPQSNVGLGAGDIDATHFVRGWLPGEECNQPDPLDRFTVYYPEAADDVKTLDGRNDHPDDFVGSAQQQDWKKPRDRTLHFRANNPTRDCKPEYDVEES